MQSIIVSIILAGCAVYVGWRLYSNIRTPADPSEGCKGCEMKDRICQKQKKGHCCDKNS